MPRATLILALLLTGAVQAVETTGMPMSSTQAAPVVTGSATRTWLELQRSGQSAAPVRPMSGEAASHVYRRYLRSFDHPLPMFFERESGIAPE